VNNADDQDFILHDKSAQKVLIELFFSCNFNATLIFHQPSFMRRWRENNLPQTLLLPVCAMATKYEYTVPLDDPSHH
jgi:hypothetical protein